MTSVASWDPVGPTDADLVRAAAGGDRGAFAGIYDRYADRLHDFCVGMLRDRDSAADCVQDAFCTAATHLTQLREPDKLRPWLYSIARNEALRRLRERRRETPSDELPDAMSHEPGPDTLAARTELADLIAEAAGGLSDRDRSVLELAYRHGLDGPELAEALGVSPGNANKMVYRLRETIANSLGALLVSRRARNTTDGCPELAAVLGDWDGRFSVLMRKRIARHVESCPTCDEDRQRLVSPAALLVGAPALIPAPVWLRERTLSDIRLDSLATPLSGDVVDPDCGSTNSGTAVDDSYGRRRKMTLLVALFVATLMISLGLTIIWSHGRSGPVPTIDVSDTVPEPLSTTPPEASPSIPTPTPSTGQVTTTTVPAVTTPPVIEPPPVPSTDPPAPPVVSEPPPPAATPELPPSPPPSSVPTVSLRPRVPASQPPSHPSIVLRPTPRTRPPKPPSVILRPKPPADPPDRARSAA